MCCYVCGAVDFVIEGMALEELGALRAEFGYGAEAALEAC